MIDFLDKSEILKVIRGYNPWWDGGPTGAPKFNRLAFHACLQYLNNASLRRAILLSGPRRVGKTTVLQQVVDHFVSGGQPPKSLLYVSLDHPLLKLVTLPKILRLYHESVHPSGKPAVLFLDEVQYSKEWQLEIKQLVDHHPEYRILSTGSATAVTKEGLSESGVGRWVTIPIPTLSFYEFLHIRDESIPDIPKDIKLSNIAAMSRGDLTSLAAKLHPLMPLFARYLLVGGFPETAFQVDMNLCQRLLREDVVERVLKRDMTMLFGLRNVSDLEKLFIYLCLHTGGIFSVKTCADSLGTSPITVSNHLSVLERAHLIYRLPPFATKGKQILKARQKVHLVDAALRNAVLLRGEDILSDPTEMGRIVETTILRHLFAYYFRDTPRISYWNDPAPGKKREVDIIVSSPQYTIPVEVKYEETASLGEKEGIVEFCRRESVKQAYWVTKNEDDFGLKEFPGLSTQFIKIPAHIFAYLLGHAERQLWVN
jgi:predicted AAA+ superfamily ATPase